MYNTVYIVAYGHKLVNFDREIERYKQIFTFSLDSFSVPMIGAARSVSTLNCYQDLIS